MQTSPSKITDAQVAEYLSVAGNKAKYEALLEEIEELGNLYQNIQEQMDEFIGYIREPISRAVIYLKTHGRLRKKSTPVAIKTQISKFLI